MTRFRLRICMANGFAFGMAAALLLVGGAVAGGQDEALPRSAFVSDASYVVGTYQPDVGERTPATMAAAAREFVESLEPAQRDKAHLALDDAERQQWTNLPARPDAGGIRLGELNAEQIRAFCRMLATMTSEAGYQKAIQIMLADDQLLAGGQPRPGFGTETFGVVVFGEPKAGGEWALQVDGHHLGMNISLAGDNYSLSPSFIGTQPEGFQLGKSEFRPLRGETDFAYELIASLSDDQKRQAIASPQRSNLRTGPGQDWVLPEPEGIVCDQLTDDQRERLRQLVSQWIDLHPETFAQARMAQLDKEWDQTRLTWYGETINRGAMSYRIQGPSLVIEYACQSMGGNPLDHLHSMYRDPTNEYAGHLRRKSN